MMALLNPATIKLALIVGAVLAVLSGIAWLRHDAAHNARNEVAVEAATHEQETRKNADEAAAAAGRAGADKLLRAGRF